MATKAVLMHVSGRPYIVVMSSKGKIIHANGPSLSLWYAVSSIRRGLPKWWDDDRLLPRFAANPAEYRIVWRVGDPDPIPGKHNPSPL
jgi:hypothetical protein